jgi:hypothetical protein
LFSSKENTGKSPAELKEASSCLFEIISEFSKVDLDLNSIRYILFIPFDLEF